MHQIVSDSGKQTLLFKSKGDLIQRIDNKSIGRAKRTWGERTWL